MGWGLAGEFGIGRRVCHVWVGAPEGVAVAGSAPGSTSLPPSLQVTSGFTVWRWGETQGVSRVGWGTRGRGCRGFCPRLQRSLPPSRR